MPLWWTIRAAVAVCFGAAMTYAVFEALAGAAIAHRAGLTVAILGALAVSALLHVRVRDVADDTEPLPVGRAPLSVALGLATVLGSLVYFEMAQWGFDGLDRIASGEATWGAPEPREPLEFVPFA